MKKKILIFLTTVICLIALALGLSACGGREIHTHSYEDSIVQPTCTEQGYTLHTCSCEESYRDNYTDALGHNLTHHEGKEATCTEIGWEAYDTCSRCDYSTYKVIPAHHNLTHHEGKEATCTEIGWEAYDTCSRCNYSTYAELPLRDHNYVDGICTMCRDKRPSQGLIYTLSSDKTYYTVLGIGTCMDTDVVIPSVYNGLPVTSIGYRTFYNCTGLTSITIPDSVTNIGWGAFSSCTGLTSIQVSSENTIYHSSNNCLIETESKTLILGCKNSIIPTDGSVTSIGNYAFYNCTGLTSITIPNSMTSIGWCAFEYCTSLKSVTIGNGVTSIGDQAFYNCTGLTSVVIPDSVTSIGNYAFYNCTGLTSVKITDLAAWCGISFENAYANPLYYAKKLYLNETLVTDLVIPSSVTSIGNSAFENCTGLTNVTIGNGVTSIGNYAFTGCKGLTSITVPDSVTSIGNSAFCGCTNLTNVTFKNPNGWWVSRSSTATSGTSISSSDLANPATAAEYLKSTYCYYYWKRG